MSAKVKGLPELIAKLRELGARETLETISYRATFGAAKEMREAARANAIASTQEHTGALSRGFAMKRIAMGTRRGYTVGVRMGNTRDRSQRKAGDNPFYWWFLEFGTRFIPPMGFFRRAFAEARTKAPAQIIAAGRKAVLASGNRALKKIGNGKAA